MPVMVLILYPHPPKHMENYTPEFAQLTPRGVRRLYQVPAGCKLSITEYAAQNGFKKLVMPERPAEGYWRHEWHETETEVVLTWVETDPPSEDEMI